MPNLVSYRGLQVLNTPPPSQADAGLAYHNNFKILANRTGDSHFDSRDPGASDDNDGSPTGVFFTTFSLWVNTVTKAVWMCIDASIGAAVWIQISSGTTSTGGDLFDQWPPLNSFNNLTV